MKNRNHWFKVKPGDDARLFRDVDIETEGFIARLRRTAHDCTPYGFLVDHRQRPYDAKKIADITHLSNNRAGLVLSEARGAALIQTAAEFRNDLQRAAKGNKRVLNKIAVFDEMCATLGSLKAEEVDLMPTLVDEYLESESMRRVGKKGGNPMLAEVVNHPLNHMEKGLDKSQSQISESVSESLSKSDSKTQREKSTSARTQAEPDDKPLTWSAYNTQCFKISAWQKSQPKSQSPERFEAEFEAAFQMSWTQWSEIKRLMEISIPKPCQDGHHVLDGAHCVYCPFLSVGEESA